MRKYLKVDQNIESGKKYFPYYCPMKIIQKLRNTNISRGIILLGLIFFTFFCSAKGLKFIDVGEISQKEVSNAYKISFGEKLDPLDLSKSAYIELDFHKSYETLGMVWLHNSIDSILIDTKKSTWVEVTEKGSYKLKIKPKDLSIKPPKKNKMSIKALTKYPYFTNDAIVFGLLALCLAFVFYTSTRGGSLWKKFYTIFPALLMCYLLPSILTSLGIISSDISKSWYFSKNFLLPTSLVLMTLSIDFKGIVNLGSKSVIMFLTGTVGIIIGGPLAILIVSTFSPETIGGAGPDAVWRGLATLAGSWIGGGANQTAMLEIYQYNQANYGGMVLVDIVVANIWMAFLLFGVGRKEKIDKWLKADTTAIDKMVERVEKYTKSIVKIPELADLIIIIGVGFSVTAFAHFVSIQASGYFSGTVLRDSVLAGKFFWLVVVATTLGLILSFTKARNLEAYGASKMGSVFIYILVASIGMKMDLMQIFENPMLIVVGLIWMAIHVILLIAVAKWIRAPFFLLAVGSKANVGGAASAPVVAAAFHPSLAPVGVLLAVLGYALGTYGAMLCAYLMQVAAP